MKLLWSWGVIILMQYMFTVILIPLWRWKLTRGHVSLTPRSYWLIYEGGGEWWLCVRFQVVEWYTYFKIKVEDLEVLGHKSGLLVARRHSLYLVIEMKFFSENMKWWPVIRNRITSTTSECSFFLKNTKCNVLTNREAFISNLGVIYLYDYHVDSQLESSPQLRRWLQNNMKIHR